MEVTITLPLHDSDEEREHIEQIIAEALADSEQFNTHMFALAARDVYVGTVRMHVGSPGQVG